MSSDRHLYLGASEVATLFGVSSYQTPYELWLAKTEEHEPTTDRDASLVQMVGHAMEGPLLAMTERELDEPVTRRQEAVIHPELPFLRSTLDGFLERSGACVEAKHTFRFAAEAGWGEPGTSEIPDAYYIQTQTQMLCTGTKLCVVPALFRLRSFRLYYVEQDPALQADIITKAKDFWHLVETRKPPDIAPDRPGALRALKLAYSTVEESEVQLDNAVFLWHQVMLDAQYQAKLYTTTVETAEAHILRMMGDSAIGWLPDGSRYVRKKVNRKAYSVGPSSYVLLLHKKAPEEKR